MLKLTFSALVAALAIGCAPTSSDNDRPLSSESEIGTADGDYLTFASRAEAEAWFAAYRPKIEGLFGPGAGPAVAAEDPQTQRIDRLVAKHWPTIVRRFGVRIPQPYALVVPSTITNAFSLYDVEQAKAADVIVMLSKLMDTLDDDHLEAVVVHELGHLVMKNVIPAYARSLLRHYETGDVETLGYLADDDAAARSTIEAYVHDGFLAGYVAPPELSDVPLGNLAAFLALTASQHPENPDCAAVAAAFNTMTRVLWQASTPAKELDLGDAQRTELTAAVDDIHAKAASCVHPTPEIDLAHAMAEIFHTLGAGTARQGLAWYASQLSPEDQAIAVGKDALTGTYDVTSAVRARVRAVTTSPSFVHLRQFTNEEQADDFAMTILHADGLDPVRMGDAMMLQAPQPYRDACGAVLASGAVPAYGIQEAHHTTCYRLFHARAFKAHLEAGGPGTTPSVPALKFDRRVFDPTIDRRAVD